MSKFDTLFEQQVARFVKSGPIAGDYVKFKAGCESSDWYKSLDASRQNYIQEIKTLSEQGKPLMLSTIKKGLYETDTVDSQAQLADVVVEYAPGFYHQSVTLPLELLEFAEDFAEHRGTVTDPTNNQKDNTSLKPEVAEDKAIDGHQTKVPGGDYKLGTANYMP
jgi:hypothetical protein|tara:strand:- start:66 stop:557 length:492 start_codon:yes stop_codon:yes gene_type:complete